MPAWSEYRDTARARGALALELYRIETTPIVPPQELGETLPAHLDYQKKLEAEGKLVLAGPLSDDSGEQMNGSGMIIYRAESMEQARRLAENDPMHAQGKRSFTLRRWLINEGSLTISVKLSGQSMSLE